MTKAKAVFACIACGLLGILTNVGYQQLHVNNDPMVISVDGPTTAQPGDIIEYKLTVKNPSWFLNKVVTQWQVLRGEDTVAYRQITDTDILLPAGTSPTKYLIVTSVSTYHNYFLWGSVKPVGLVVKKVVVGAAPGPNPIPPPPPPPTPVVTGHLYAIGVFDDSNLLALPKGQLAIHNADSASTLVTSLKGLDTTWRNYDKGSTDLADPKWQATINSVGLPCLIVVDATGKVYSAVKLPATDTDTITVVSKLRGK